MNDLVCKSILTPCFIFNWERRSFNHCVYEDFVHALLIKNGHTPQSGPLVWFPYYSCALQVVSQNKTCEKTLHGVYKVHHDTSVAVLTHERKREEHLRGGNSLLPGMYIFLLHLLSIIAEAGLEELNGRHRITTNGRCENSACMSCMLCYFGPVRRRQKKKQTRFRPCKNMDNSWHRRDIAASTESTNETLP